MRGLPQHRAVWLIVGCCLLVADSGCCWQRPRHGVIVRGDFALELNRIPWMTGRGEQYPHADCGEAECAEACEPCLSGGCKRPCAGGEEAAAKPVAAAGCCNQPRFFPVPTRPVFSARADFSCPPVPPGVIRQPEGLPGAGGAMPIEVCPPRSVPSGSGTAEPELVPTPPGEKPSPDKPAGSAEPATSASALPKWLVTPPENVAKPGTTPGQASQDGWVLRR